MRRYRALFLTAFLLFVVVIAGSAYLAGSGKLDRDTARQEITAYTTLSAEHAAQLTEGYAAQRHVRVNFVPLASDELVARVASEGQPQAALVLADAATLKQLAAAGKFTPYLSEASDAVAANFKQADGLWTGVWYDPIVFAVNADYLRAQAYVPDNWWALAEPGSARVGITDFVAAEASANLLYSLIAAFGEQEAYRILRGIHPKVVQYAKYLANPVRQAGMGETDISVAVASEALRYTAEGYPLRILYPTDGTAYTLTGLGALAGTTAEEQEAAGTFLDWLLSDDAQFFLQSRGFYYLTTNPATLAYQTFAGKNLALFPYPPEFTAAQKQGYLDRWVKYIRFSS